MSPLIAIKKISSPNKEFERAFNEAISRKPYTLKEGKIMTAAKKKKEPRRISPRKLAAEEKRKEAVEYVGEQNLKSIPVAPGKTYTRHLEQHDLLERLLNENGELNICVLLADSRVFETAQAEGDPLIDGINSQIYKMMKVGSRSDRREREAAYNTGFSTPGGCTSMMFHKLTRLLALDADGNVRLLADNFDPEYIAEELRDCALYALRCADLMEG